SGYYNEEFVEGIVGMKCSILSKYDKDYEGPWRQRISIQDELFDQVSDFASRKGQQVFAFNQLGSLYNTKNLETMDYLKEGDIGFKKSEMKKKRPSRRAPVEAELAPEDEMDVDQKPFPRIHDLETNFVDELQVALAISRRAKLHKPKITS
ncbi:hypothetical protein BT96DRAFT_808978, partial [Gymnopus androsaceus JB14]